MIINKLEMNLNRCTVAPIIDAVQGDKCSRILEIYLHASGKPFIFPENSTVLIRYRKADGKGGEYDTLPDSSSAWAVHGSNLSLTLAPQALTTPGDVFMTVVLLAHGKQLSTFPLRIRVHPAAEPLLADSEDYFNITGFLAAPGNARIGQYLQISSVDSSGKVTGIAAADATFSGTGSGSTPADWNADEYQPGHILNRPFYSAFQNVTILEPITLTASTETEGMGILPETLDLVDGMACTVTYNGTDYSCTVQEIQEDILTILLLGNGAAIGADDTGEPFCIAVFPGETADLVGMPGGIIPMDGSETFTVSISGIRETIIHLPQKYLPEIRAQKKIILNLDDNSANLSVNSTADMDTGELQAAISVIYEGLEHSAIISKRETVQVQGIVYCSVILLVAHEVEQSASPKLLTCLWDPSGLHIKYENTLATPFTIGSHSMIYLMAKLPSDGSVTWRKISDLAFDGIVLQSTTPNSLKKFQLTVDDSGTLSVKSMLY